MKIMEIVGIDVSKKTLDVHFFSCNLTFKTNNSPEGYVSILEACKEHINESFENTFFVLKILVVTVNF